MLKKIPGLSNGSTSKLPCKLDKVPDWLFLAGIAILLIIALLSKENRVAWITGMATIVLALFTFFSARSTSSLARQSRLDRQLPYITEFIGLVVDPLIEVAELCKERVSSREIAWERHAKVVAERYVGPDELARFEVKIDGTSMYFLPDIYLEIMESLKFQHSFELRRSQQIEEYDKILMEKIAQFDEHAQRFPKELGIILVSIHSCLVQSARLDHLENNVRPYLRCYNFPKDSFDEH